MIAAAVRDDLVEIVVSDNGIGIPPSQLGRMFEPYVQLAAPDGRWRSGLGIGLSVVRNLVDMHGGQVTAASDGVGKGARFMVTLPTTRAAATGNADSTEPARQPVRQLRVLIVDDNHDAAESLAMILHEHEVQCAFDGEAALATAEKFPADVAILDIGLPGIDGYELARRLRTLPGTAHTVLVALSGFGAPEDRARSREAGFEQHFVKPVNPQTLIDFLSDSGSRRASHRDQR
jgi:two-component system CheB/CheR fusion protein